MSETCAHAVGIVDNGIEVWLAYESPTENDIFWMNTEDSWFKFCPWCGEPIVPEPE